MLTQLPSATQSGGATVCADNGYDGDGPTKLFRNEGGACSGGDYSAGCCGGLYCVNSLCTNKGTGGLPLGAGPQTGQLGVWGSLGLALDPDRPTAS